MDTRKLWFKTKRYGWGWTPAAWQGWAVTFLYAGMIIIGSMWLLPSGEDWPPLTYYLWIVFCTLALMLITYKTGEKPRWRWGGK